MDIVRVFYLRTPDCYVSLITLSIFGISSTLLFVDSFAMPMQVNRIGDGYCDPDNNKAECNYDGGDCCECTCEVGFFADDDSAGGCSQFACIDPAAPCVDEDLITVDMVEKCDDVSGAGVAMPRRRHARLSMFAERGIACGL